MLCSRYACPQRQNSSSCKSLCMLDLVCAEFDSVSVERRFVIVFEYVKEHFTSIIEVPNNGSAINKTHRFPVFVAHDAFFILV